MSNSEPRSWLDRAVGVCLSVLVGAAAVFIAVKLIEAVWAVLLVIIGIAVVVTAAVAIARARKRGW